MTYSPWSLARYQSRYRPIGTPVRRIRAAVPLLTDMMEQDPHDVQGAGRAAARLPRDQHGGLIHRVLQDQSGHRQASIVDVALHSTEFAAFRHMQGVKMGSM